MARWRSFISYRTSSRARASESPPAARWARPSSASGSSAGSKRSTGDGRTAASFRPSTWWFTSSPRPVGAISQLSARSCYGFSPACGSDEGRQLDPSPGVPARRLQAPPLSPAPSRLPVYSDLFGVCPVGASQIRLLARGAAGHRPAPALPAVPSGWDRSSLGHGGLFPSRSDRPKGLNSPWIIAGCFSPFSSP